MSELSSSMSTGERPRIVAIPGLVFQPLSEEWKRRLEDQGLDVVTPGIPEALTGYTDLTAPPADARSEAAARYELAIREEILDDRDRVRASGLVVVNPEHLTVRAGNQDIEYVSPLDRVTLGVLHALRGAVALRGVGGRKPFPMFAVGGKTGLYFDSRGNEPYHGPREEEMRNLLYRASLLRPAEGTPYPTLSPESDPAVIASETRAYQSNRSGQGES